MKLFIDDLRMPPPGWVLARSSSEAVEIVEKAGAWPEAISFDHDLGGEDIAPIFVKAIIELALDGKIRGPEHNFRFFVHSMNSSGRSNLAIDVQGFYRHCNGEAYPYPYQYQWLIENGSQNSLLKKMK